MLSKNYEIHYAMCVLVLVVMCDSSKTVAYSHVYELRLEYKHMFFDDVLFLSSFYNQSTVFVISI